MKNLKYASGIDVSKSDFKACISVISEDLPAVSRQAVGFRYAGRCF